MPLVFVHGVATRDSPEYSRSCKLRDALFKEIALDGIGSPSRLDIYNPYWGSEGASFAWDHASVPGQRNESFGLTLATASDVLLNTVEHLPDDLDQTLVTIAKTSPEAAVDALFAMSALDDTGADYPGLAKLAARALKYARGHPVLPWLDGVDSDTVFVDRLQLEIDKEFPPPAAAGETFGFGDFVTTLKTAVVRIAQAASDVGTEMLRRDTEPLVTWARPWLDARVTIFVGDVLAYLNTRGTPSAPGSIVRSVSEAFARAQNGNPDRKRDPAIIVAHSMGGNITYDILTHFHKELSCDVLVSVGSQVALFEEMKLYGASDPKLKGPKPTAPKPPNVGCWINVYDMNDVLAYVAATVFQGVADYAFDTGKSVFGAHSAYFLRPSFHQRLNVRLKAALP